MSFFRQLWPWRLSVLCGAVAVRADGAVNDWAMVVVCLSGVGPVRARVVFFPAVVTVTTACVVQQLCIRGWVHFPQSKGRGGRLFFCLVRLLWVPMDGWMGAGSRVLPDAVAVRARFSLFPAEFGR